jgi:glyoxylase-like metal-dependent hydrolase (beta-lactamase superfamily II)
MEAGRPARRVRDGLWLVPPNRDSQGGSAWWLEGPGPDGAGGCLIDCPAYTEANLALLRSQAEGRAEGRILLTSREGHGRVRRFQEALGWPVLVQEQEAYLLPGVQRLQPFGAELALAPGLQVLWTPGPTPGASVVLAQGGALGAAAVLFCGRLLSPVAPAQAAPLRHRRSFHWGRWLRSLERLRGWLPAPGPGTPPLWLASGAGLGALRGEALIPQGWELLQGLDLQALALQPPA